MTIDADEAVCHRENPKKTDVTATENSIKYKGITKDGKTFTGNSKKLKYTPEREEAILIDETFVRLNGNTLSAGIITYNTITKNDSLFCAR